MLLTYMRKMARDHKGTVEVRGSALASSAKGAAEPPATSAAESIRMRRDRALPKLFQLISSLLIDTRGGCRSGPFASWPSGRWFSGSASRCSLCW